MIHQYTPEEQESLVATARTVRRRIIPLETAYVDLTGSIYAALLLAQGYYWADGRTTLPGGWFYKTTEEWESETRLTKDQQLTARKVLRSISLIEPNGNELPIWQEDLRGVPPKGHYLVNNFAIIVATTIVVEGGHTYPGYNVKIGNKLVVEYNASQENGSQDEPVKLDASGPESQLAGKFPIDCREGSQTLHRVLTENTKNKTYSAGAGDSTAFASQEIVAATLPSGSTINGAGSKARTNGNGAATLPSGSNKQPARKNKFEEPQSRAGFPAKYDPLLKKAARGVDMDVDTFATLASMIATAAHSDDAIASSEYKAIQEAADAASRLAKWGIRTTEAMQALIASYREQYPTQLYGVEVSLCIFRSKQLQGVEGYQHKVLA